MPDLFYLVRHGEKEKLVGDPPLTELGWQQARKTSTFLAKQPRIDHLFSSPSLRTKQTAEGIAESLNLPIKYIDLLRERTNWEDPSQSFADCLKIWNEATERRDWTPPQGDSSRTAGQRMQSAIESASELGQNIVFSTHGGIIADFLLNVFPLAELDAVKPGFSVMKENCIKECSITTVSFDEESRRYQLLTLADTTHLD